MPKFAAGRCPFLASRLQVSTEHFQGGPAASEQSESLNWRRLKKLLLARLVHDDRKPAMADAQSAPHAASRLESSEATAD
jgi:hypothetical protein